MGQASVAEIDERKLAELNRMMASIPSPTGEEGQLARAVVDAMNTSGVGAYYQQIDGAQGNAIGRIEGQGDGVDLCFMRPWTPRFQPTRTKNVRGSAIGCRKR